MGRSNTSGSARRCNRGSGFGRLYRCAAPGGARFHIVEVVLMPLESMSWQVFLGFTAFKAVRIAVLLAVAYGLVRLAARRAPERKIVAREPSRHQVRRELRNAAITFAFDQVVFFILLTTG